MARDPEDRVRQDVRALLTASVGSALPGEVDEGLAAAGMAAIDETIASCPDQETALVYLRRCVLEAARLHAVTIAGLTSTLNGLAARLADATGHEGVRFEEASVWRSVLAAIERLDAQSDVSGPESAGPGPADPDSADG